MTQSEKLCSTDIAEIAYFAFLFLFLLRSAIEQHYTADGFSEITPVL